MTTGFTLWFTGANIEAIEDYAAAVEATLLEQGADLELITEQMMRDDFGRELGDDAAAAEKLAHRAAIIANMLSRNGVPVVVAVAAPTRAIRDSARELVGQFCEVFVPGEGAGFEAPEKTEISVEDGEDPEAAATKIIQTLSILGFRTGGDGTEYSAEEEEKIKKRLKDLGYI